MNTVNEIVEQVMTRLNRRKQQVYSVSQAQLAQGLAARIYLDYARLHLQLPDLGFMTRLANRDAQHPAVATVLEAWSYGVHLHISLHSRLLNALPASALRPLPLTLSDHQGAPVRLHAGNVLTYADVVQLADCWLIVERRTLITALAQDVLTKKRVRLIRQE